MAYFALKRWFLHFRKKPYIDQIQAYRQQRYTMWYQSLSDTQRQVYDAKQQKKQLMAIQSLNTIIHMTNRMIGDN